MTTPKPTIIFHVPFPLDRQLNAGSALSPVVMRKAFQELGFAIREVSGKQTQRRNQIQQLKREIRHGLDVAFVYSEASSSPTGLGEKVSFRTSFTLDLSFLRFCARRGIPVGLFYGDIFWRFPFYDALVKSPRRQILKALHRWDVWRYHRYGLRVYLPTTEMAKWVPYVKLDQIRARYPGSYYQPELRNRQRGRQDSLSFFYVGGLGSHYNLHEFMRALRHIPEATLTICTTEGNWAKTREEYADLLTERVRIVHANADELAPYYAAADVCVLAVQPNEYWQFAAPFKLFEYMSFGKPVLATANTWPGAFVKHHGFGWVGPDSESSWKDLIRELVASPEGITEAAARVAAARKEHTWISRARDVAKDLAPELDPPIER